MRKRKQRRTAAVIIIGIIMTTLIVVSAFIYLAEQDVPGYGRINHVESGLQVDSDVQEEPSIPLSCTVIECGDGLAVFVDIGQTEILYDAGSESHGEIVSKKISPKVDGRLDYVIISHSHADHAGGIPHIIENFDVDTVITSGEKKGSKQFEKAMQEVNTEGCTVISDDDLNFDLEQGAQLTIYDILDPADEDNPNNLSVIATITYGEDTILLTGDAEKAAEQKLKGMFSEVSVFVAGHHMSNTSNSNELLQEWMPEYIIGSCRGKGSAYGFPHKEAIERMLAITPNVYATFKNGDITYTTDGMNGQVNAEDPLTADDAA